MVQEIAVANYPFQPDAITANPLFRIDVGQAVLSHRLEDFLIPHRKDYYFFALVKQGSSRHWIDGVPYVLKPDTLYFTTPHQVQLKEEARHFTGTVLSFTRDMLLADCVISLAELPVIPNLHNAHELNLSNEDIGVLETLLANINREYLRPAADYSQSMITGYLRVFLSYVSRLYNAQYGDAATFAERSTLHRFLQAVESNFKTLHDVGAYADMLSISAGHLSDIVKQLSGKTAIALIHERMAVEAKRLLFHTDGAVKEIAFNLGFEDASYFARFFKRLTGQTPQAYRSINREMYR